MEQNRAVDRFGVKLAPQWLQVVARSGAVAARWRRFCRAHRARCLACLQLLQTRAMAAGFRVTLAKISSSWPQQLHSWVQIGKGFTVGGPLKPFPCHARNGPVVGQPFSAATDNRVPVASWRHGRALSASEAAALA